MTGEERGRRGRERGVTAALVLVALGGAAWLASSPRRPEPRPAPTTRVLDETLAVPAKGVARRVRVAQPCALSISIGGPAGTEFRARLGVPKRGDEAAPEAPDPAGAEDWTAGAGDGGHRTKAMFPGIYVLWIEPAEGRAVDGATLVVERLRVE